jgi:hypothetical protein
MPKKRATSSDRAREVRAKGHADAREFALLIGLPSDYKNDLKAKKDVIDHNGDAHSVKSGNKWRQIFLYSFNRIKTDYAFAAMIKIDSAIHYREIKFRLNKLKILTLLQLAIAPKEPICINGADAKNKLIRYGDAIKKFR